MPVGYASRLGAAPPKIRSAASITSHATVATTGAQRRRVAGSGITLRLDNQFAGHVVSF